MLCVWCDVVVAGYRRNADEFDVHIYTCFLGTSLWNRFLSLYSWRSTHVVCLFINGKRENCIAERYTVLSFRCCFRLLNGFFSSTLHICSFCCSVDSKSYSNTFFLFKFEYLQFLLAEYFLFPMWTFWRHFSSWLHYQRNHVYGNILCFWLACQKQKSKFVLLCSFIIYT